MENILEAVNEAAKQVDNPYGFNLNSAVIKVAAPYDNDGACKELAKDMQRGDNLSIKFTKDADGYASIWVESKNVAGYKVRLNPSILSWLMAKKASTKSTVMWLMRLLKVTTIIKI